MDKLLRVASERGAVMVGGSAGAICWFDGGHSDSLDPTTVRPECAGGYEQQGTAHWCFIKNGA